MVQLLNTFRLKLVLGILTLISKVCCNHTKVREVKQYLFRPITGPEGSRRFRLSAHEGGMSAQRTGRLYPQQIPLILIYARD